MGIIAPRTICTRDAGVANCMGLSIAGLCFDCSSSISFLCSATVPQPDRTNTNAVVARAVAVLY